MILFVTLHSPIDSLNDMGMSYDEDFQYSNLKFSEEVISARLYIIKTLFIFG